MKKRPDKHEGGQPETRRRRSEAADHVTGGRARVSEVLEAEPTEDEQGFLGSLGLESIEEMVQDQDAAMTALSMCGTSEGLEDISPILFGRLLCALAESPEYAQMIVESEEDNSFQDAIKEMSKSKRPLYLAQLQKAVEIARATLEK